MQNRIRSAAFTLIELIGVIAIIALLAALLIPRIVDVIRDASVTSTVSAVNNVKSASAVYFQKVGSFPTPSTTSTNFDATLVSGGFLEKTFGSKLSADADVKIVAGSGTMTDEGAFNLVATGTTSSTGTGDRVVLAILPGLSATDALRLNQLIDGSTDTAATADNNGKCKLADNTGTWTARIYIAH